jgi:hypothetical protein
MAAVMAFVTVGFSWLVYPFFAERIIETHYLRLGWEKVGTAPAAAPQVNRRSGWRIILWSLGIAYVVSVVFVLVYGGLRLS